MNNKGFAVSAVLYTLLIAFLLFLAAALAMFSSSNSLISNANSDIVNGNPFSAVRVPIARDKLIELPISRRTDQDSWGSGKVVQIKSKYGVKYWPNNFALIYGEDVKKTYYKWEFVSINTNGISFKYINLDGELVNVESNCTIEQPTSCIKQLTFIDGNLEVKYTYQAENNMFLTITDTSTNESILFPLP